MKKTDQLNQSLTKCQLDIEDTERKLFVITDGIERDRLLTLLSDLYDKRTQIKSQITKC